MDRLYLHQLAVPVIIGVYPEELQNQQIIYIDLEIALDITKAAVKDDLTCTVDYAAIYHFIFSYLPTTQFMTSVRAVTRNPSA